MTTRKWKAMRRVTLGITVPLSLLMFSGLARAQAPTVEQALQLEPLQDGVDYDRPAADEIPKCDIKVEKINGNTGWIVTGSSGERLRMFLDTNGDKKVDFWAYFKDGVEVYRDIDSNFNGTADQYRWLGTAGIRWGLDRDESGEIDTWKMISPEEVSSEVVEAARNVDVDRFRALLLTQEEFATLGLEGDKAKEVSEMLKSSVEDFKKWAQAQKQINNSTKWVHFGATRPGLVPAGTEGLKKDLVVYENAIAVLETSGEHSQIDLGTMVRVGDNWKLISAPKVQGESGQLASNQGYFFSVSYNNRPATGESGETPGMGAELQSLLGKLEQLDQRTAQATTPQAQEKLAQERMALIKQIIASTTDAEMKENWIRQLADALSGAIQSGEMPNGMPELTRLASELEGKLAGTDLAAYVRFRELTAQYTRQFQDPKADFAKIQEAWLEKLEGFIKQYPKSEDAAEAMMQLAIAHEFAGEDNDAKKWYDQIRNNFSETSLAEKATGAIRRISTVGQPMRLAGTSTDGKKVDLASYKGKVVLVHYWATWCEPCKEDMAVMRQMQAKYGARGFQLIGVSLDSDRSALTQFLGQNRLAWPQLYEEGGLDSRYALEMGVLTLPTMILVGADGKVISRSLHISQLDSELTKLIK